MTLTQPETNGLLIAGMVVILLVILGIVTALRGGGKKKAAAQVPTWADTEGIDLEDRLRKITMSSLKPVEEAPRPSGRAEAPAATIDRPAPGPRTDLAERPRPAGTPARPTPSANTQTPATQRLALPSSGSVQATDASLPPMPAGQGLNPLAARFMPTENPTGPTMRPQLPGPTVGGIANALPPIGGQGGDNRGTPTGGFSMGDMPARGGRLELPGPVAGGFGDLPSIEMPAAQTGAPATGQPAAGRRLGLPGTIKSETTAEPAFPSTVPLDIRAILRGEASPNVAPAPPTLAGFSIEQPAAARKPTFTTGPLPPAVEQGTPLGAVPFDPNLLKVREPAPALRPVIEPPTAPPVLDSFDFGGPATYEDPGTERVAANGRLIDLDATRIVEDFDLPDTGFETHVFSTAELVESESLGFPSAMPSMPEPVLPGFTGEMFQSPSPPPAAPPAPAQPAPGPAQTGAGSQRNVLLTPMQQEQAQRQLQELANLVDVVFVRLIAADGSVMLAAGDESADANADQHLAGVLHTAAMEIQQLDMGECSAVSVEVASVALLLSPVAAGACLAVLLSNPTRLGLLRRQVRKPLGGLRSLLSESGVS